MTKQNTVRREMPSQAYAEIWHLRQDATTLLEFRALEAAVLKKNGVTE